MNIYEAITPIFSLLINSPDFKINLLIKRATIDVIVISIVFHNEDLVDWLKILDVHETDFKILG